LLSGGFLLPQAQRTARVRIPVIASKAKQSWLGNLEFPVILGLCFLCHPPPQLDWGVSMWNFRIP
ncbi:MAG: hypothetical protein MR782_08335, partial [Campylobacter sp.]|nr:hypothetical protein [Campylobacter sp.]